MRQPYDLIELDQVQDSEQIQDALGKMTGTRTVITILETHKFHSILS
jgi:hypothetical protein